MKYTTGNHSFTLAQVEFSLQAFKKRKGFFKRSFAVSIQRESQNFKKRLCFIKKKTVRHFLCACAILGDIITIHVKGVSSFESLNKSVGTVVFDGRRSV